MMSRNIKEIIKKEILSGELREIKYKNMFLEYKNNLDCNNQDCNIFNDFKNVILFFVQYHNKKERNMAELIHDIKSPIMSIDFALKNNRSGQIINDVYYTNLASLNLIENVLTLYKQNKNIKFSKFDLIEIIDVILRNHKYLIIEKNLKVKYEPKIDYLEIKSCPVCCGRIISNLLSNAIKFSPQNKTIEIKLEKYKDVISILISNNVEKNLKSTNRNGLGLNISKLLARKINGKIRVKKDNSKVMYSLDFIPQEVQRIES